MAAPRYEVELKVLSATNLKNVNWKYGPLRPYVVASLDADKSVKANTSVAPLADSCPDGVDPVWDVNKDPRAKVILPLPRHADIDDAALLIDVFHAKDPQADEDGVKIKPIVGSARILARDVLEEVGIGEGTLRSVRLNRPSGRPQGVLVVMICVREPPSRYYYDSSHHPPTAGYHGASGYPANPSRDSRYGYGAPVPPPVGYPYGSEPAAPLPTAGYGSYGYAAPLAGYPSYGAPPAEQERSKFGVGTGVAVGAAAGLLGGLALAEGIDCMEDKIAEVAAEKVEDDLAEEYGCSSDNDY